MSRSALLVKYSLTTCTNLSLCVMCKKKLAKFIFKLLAAAFMMASVSWVQFNAGTLRKLSSVDKMKIYQNYILKILILPLN